MTDDPCQACYTYPCTTPGYWLCERCAEGLHGNLHAILGSPGRPGLAHELDLELTGQARKTSGGRVTTPTPAMPVNLAASDCLTAIRHQLLAGCVLVAGDFPPIPNTVPDLADWLLNHEDRFARRSGCGPIAEAIHNLVNQARRIIDTPAEKRHYLGICGRCEAPMRSVKPDGPYRCQCGQDYDIETQRAEIATRIHDPDNRMTLTEISQLTGLSLAALGMRVKRGHIAPVVGAGRGAWYRYGDIITDENLRPPKWSVNVSNVMMPVLAEHS